MEADLSDLSDSWRDMYSANFQINQINLFLFYRTWGNCSLLFSRTQIAQIKGIISLALVICICEIPKICGL